MSMGNGHYRTRKTLHTRAAKKSRVTEEASGNQQFYVAREKILLNANARNLIDFHVIFTSVAARTRVFAGVTGPATTLREC